MIRFPVLVKDAETKEKDASVQVRGWGREYQQVTLIPLMESRNYHFLGRKYVSRWRKILRKISYFACTSFVNAE